MPNVQDAAIGCGVWPACRASPAAPSRRTSRPGRSPGHPVSPPAARPTATAAPSAQRMGEILGQQVVIENVGGAGGMTGSQARRRGGAGRLHVRDRQPSAATASTRRSTSGRSTIRKTDFAPVGLVANQVRSCCSVRKDLPANTTCRSSSPTPRRTRPRCSSARPAPARPRISVCVLLNMALGHQHHPHSLSRHRTGDAGSGRRPPRLSCASRCRPRCRMIQGNAVKPLALLARNALRRCCRNIPTAARAGAEGLRGA